jgi:serine/threonine protein kinase
MAPELTDGAVMSVATDLFSFGMLMRQVLHPGDPQPFGSNAMVIMRKLDKGERPPFTRADAPPALKDLVTRCLAHDPSQRPSSMWDVRRELTAIMQQLPDTSPPSSLALLLAQPDLSPASHSSPPATAGVELVDEPTTSAFAAFVRLRMRREVAVARVNRISRVNVSSSRMATYMDLFMREMNSRSSNLMLRPANPTDSASVAGLRTLKSVFERTCLGPSPPCNIVFAWHGTPAQYVQAVCRDGPRAFRTTDGGFFGAGSYFALELEYAARYAMMQVHALFLTSQCHISHSQQGAVSQRRVPRHLVRCQRGVRLRGHAFKGLPC